MQEIYYFSFLNGPNQVTAYEEEKPVPKILTSQPHRCQPNWFTKEITNLDGLAKSFCKECLVSIIINSFNSCKAKAHNRFSSLYLTKSQLYRLTRAYFCINDDKDLIFITFFITFQALFPEVFRESDPDFF